MLKVAHLITGLETGGAERMLLRLVGMTDASRFSSIVISMTECDAASQEIAEAGVTVHSLGIRRGFPDPRMISRLVRILRAFRPDVLQTWLYHADMLGLVARELGSVPRLVWNLRCTDSIGTKTVRGLLRHCSGLPDAVIVNSMAGQAFHHKIGYRPRRWVYIPNGFDTEAFRPSPSARGRGRSALGIADGIVTILLPARHHRMKDHVNFLEAAARLAATRPDVQFVMAGRGADPTNIALTQLIRTLGLEARVMLLGKRDDLATLYPSFDIVTLSSAFGEGFPNVLGEAMASGIPCVGTDVGDSATIIGNTGRVVPPRDPVALALAWEELVALGPKGRSELGAAARVRVIENWDMHAIASQYGALYEQLVEENPVKLPGSAASLVTPFAAR